MWGPILRRYILLRSTITIILVFLRACPISGWFFRTSSILLNNRHESTHWRCLLLLLLLLQLYYYVCHFFTFISVKFVLATLFVMIRKWRLSVGRCTVYCKFLCLSIALIMTIPHQSFGIVYFIIVLISINVSSVFTLFTWHTDNEERCLRGAVVPLPGGLHIAIIIFSLFVPGWLTQAGKCNCPKELMALQVTGALASRRCTWLGHWSPEAYAPLIAQSEWGALR